MVGGHTCYVVKVSGISFGNDNYVQHMLKKNTGEVVSQIKATTKWLRLECQNLYVLLVQFMHSKIQFWMQCMSPKVHLTIWLRGWAVNDVLASAHLARCGHRTCSAVVPCVVSEGSRLPFFNLMVLFCWGATFFIDHVSRNLHFPHRSRFSQEK